MNSCTPTQPESDKMQSSSLLHAFSGSDFMFPAEPLSFLQWFIRHFVDFGTFCIFQTFHTFHPLSSGSNAFGKSSQGRWLAQFSTSTDPFRISFHNINNAIFAFIDVTFDWGWRVGAFKQGGRACAGD